MSQKGHLRVAFFLLLWWWLPRHCYTQRWQGPVAAQQDFVPPGH